MGFKTEIYIIVLLLIDNYKIERFINTENWYFIMKQLSFDYDKEEVSTTTYSPRQTALFAHDPKAYLEACVEEGFEPEDPILAEQADAERVFFEKKREQNIREFVGRARWIPLTLSTQVDTKLDLLQRYFPGRFGTGGDQDLSEEKPGKIGFIFKQVLDTYWEKYKK